MSNEEVLAAVIRKAVEQGWQPPFKTDVDFDHVVISKDGKTFDVIFAYRMDNYRVHFMEMLFDHDFARALWGEEMLNDRAIFYEEGKEPEGVDSYSTAWAYHLQQMVIADNHIEYLRENAL